MKTQRLTLKAKFLSVLSKLLQCLTPSGFPAWLISKHDISPFCSSRPYVWPPLPFQGEQVAGRPLSSFPSHISICAPELLTAKQTFIVEDLISWGLCLCLSCLQEQLTVGNEQDFVFSVLPQLNRDPREPANKDLHWWHCPAGQQFMPVKTLLPG